MAAKTEGKLAEFKAIEGKDLTVWTVHNKRQNDSGEEIVDTEVRFKEPGSGLVTKGADSDEMPPPPTQKLKAKGMNVITTDRAKWETIVPKVIPTLEKTWPSTKGYYEKIMTMK